MTIFRKLKKLAKNSFFSTSSYRFLAIKLKSNRYNIDGDIPMTRVNAIAGDKL
jgi:hypothetical protein